MHFDPRNDKCPLPYSPFKSCTVPRPIGWLSTISSKGVVNLAPYSQWQNLTFDPPMVMFAANQLSSGQRKHTVINAEETGWFVWNMATYDLREAVNISAMELPAEVNEFELAGVTPISSINAPCPRVEESPAHFECRYLSTHRLRGNSSHGWVEVVYGEVVRIHVDDDVMTPDGKLDIPRIKPLARLGYYDYTAVTDVFEMRIPGASDNAAAGLEGKSSKEA
jgi:flavin reductase (DIM6/NTAB) family NADH-FMN oxidoreductase RutF